MCTQLHPPSHQSLALTKPPRCRNGLKWVVCTEPRSYHCKISNVFEQCWSKASRQEHCSISLDSTGWIYRVSTGLWLPVKFILDDFWVVITILLTPSLNTEALALLLQDHVTKKGYYRAVGVPKYSCNVTWFYICHFHEFCATISRLSCFILLLWNHTFML